jgi:hypothetical protein
VLLISKKINLFKIFIHRLKSFNSIRKIKQIRKRRPNKKKKRRKIKIKIKKKKSKYIR